MNKNIVFVSGPAHHSDDIYNALSKEHNLTYFKYFPTFSKKTNSTTYTNPWFDRLAYLIWGFFHKFGLPKGYAKLWVFALYDRNCSKSITSNTDLLLAWPQVSLHSMQKAKNLGVKILLEYPMIHPLEWNRYLKEEYEKLQIPKVLHSSIFPEKMVEKMLQEIELADKINVLSSFAKETFLKHGVPEQKLSIIPPSIDFPNTIPTKQPSDKFIILFVGRIEVLKGVHYLLEAYSKLDMPNKELWMVGTVSEEIQSTLNLYKADTSIKLLGFKSKEELTKIYQQASVLVLPSVQESFGLVILEALANGTPVIASKNTGAPDLFKDSKLIFCYDFKDVSQLVEKLSEVRKYVSIKNYFSVKEVNFVNNYGEFYKSLLSNE